MSDEAMNDETPPEVTPRVRPRFRKFAIAAFILLVPIALFTLWDYIEARRLGAAVKALREAKQPLTTQPSNNQAMRPDNAARYYDAASALVDYQLSRRGPLLRTSALAALPEQIGLQMVEASNRVSDRFASMISDGIAEGSLRPVDPVIAAQMLNATLNACADLGALVPDVRPKAAPAVFAKPMLMGLFGK